MGLQDGMTVVMKVTMMVVKRSSKGHHQDHPLHYHLCLQ